MPESVNVPRSPFVPPRPTDDSVISRYFCGERRLIDGATGVEYVEYRVIPFDCAAYAEGEDLVVVGTTAGDFVLDWKQVVG
jgi:hypothetical protein